MTREAAAEYIRSLSATELASFIKESLQHLTEGERADGRTTYLLASCFHWTDSSGRYSESPVVYLTAPAAEPQAYLGHKGFDQSGGCRMCSAEICCPSKLAICPVCGSTVECT